MTDINIDVRDTDIEDWQYLMWELINNPGQTITLYELNEAGEPVRAFDLLECKFAGIKTTSRYGDSCE